MNDKEIDAVIRRMTESLHLFLNNLKQEVRFAFKGEIYDIKRLLFATREPLDVQIESVDGRSLLEPFNVKIKEINLSFNIVDVRDGDTLVLIEDFSLGDLEDFNKNKQG